MTVVAVLSMKGGVGKTTTAINLAAALAKSGQRTLLIDLDPQCNATSGLGLAPTERHALVLRKPLREALLDTRIAGLQVLPGSRSFQDVEVLAQGEQGESSTLRQHLATGMNAFDFVLIDCPPSLGPLTQAALAASTEVLMPIQCEYFAMEGLTQMIHVIRGVMRREPGRLEFGGILLTMHDPTLELGRFWSDTYRGREIAAFHHARGWVVYLDGIMQDRTLFDTPEGAAQWLRGHGLRATRRHRRRATRSPPPPTTT